MPNVNRQDLEALRNMVSQSNLIVSTEPMIAGGVERLRELLDTAERLADFLLTDSLDRIQQAPRKRRAGSAKIGRNSLKRR
jgi:hypothetical protein